MAQSTTSSTLRKDVASGKSITHTTDDGSATTSEARRQRETVDGASAASPLGNTLLIEKQLVRASDCQRRTQVMSRHLLSKFSGLKRVRSCGRKPVGAVAVEYGTSSKGLARSRFRGLATCGSVWACPVCSQKIQTGRALELTTAVSNHLAEGGSLAFITLTMRHKAGDSLKELWDNLTDAWTGVIRTPAWRGGSRMVGDKERYGVRGMVRVAEATHGRHGWHLHLHVLVFLTGKEDEVTAMILGRSMFKRWAAGLVKMGMEAPLMNSGGLDVQVVENPETAAEAFGNYLAKNTYTAKVEGIGFETASGGSKEARGSNRTPFQLLATIVEHLGKSAFEGWCDPHSSVDRARLQAKLTPEQWKDVQLWWEWETISKGRRQITWTRGLKAELLPDEETKDDQELAEEIDAEGEVLGAIPVDAWRGLFKEWPNARLELQEGVERCETPSLAREWLRDELRGLGVVMIELSQLVMVSGRYELVESSPAVGTPPLLPGPETHSESQTSHGHG